jgi:hypothetical protein
MRLKRLDLGVSPEAGFSWLSFFPLKSFIMEESSFEFKPWTQGTGACGEPAGTCGSADARYSLTEEA